MNHTLETPETTLRRAEPRQQFEFTISELRAYAQGTGIAPALRTGLYALIECANDDNPFEDVVGGAEIAESNTLALDVCQSLIVHLRAVLRAEIDEQREYLWDELTRLEAIPKD